MRKLESEGKCWLGARREVAVVTTAHQQQGKNQRTRPRDLAPLILWNEENKQS